MQHITGIARNQMVLSSLEDTILPDNPVCLMDAFANSIDSATVFGTTGKNPRGKGKNLIRLGVDHHKYYEEKNCNQKHKYFLLSKTS